MSRLMSRSPFSQKLGTSQRTCWRCLYQLFLDTVTAASHVPVDIRLLFTYRTSNAGSCVLSWESESRINDLTYNIISDTFCTALRSTDEPSHHTQFREITRPFRSTMILHLYSRLPFSHRIASYPHLTSNPPMQCNAI